MPLNLGAPQNWEELEQAFASIQSAIGRLEGWGNWRDMDFVASNYYATTGTWTVPTGAQRVYRYSVQAALMQIQIHLVGTTTGSGMSTELFIRLPEGYGILPNTGYVGTARWNAGANLPPAIVSGGTIAQPNSLQLIRDVASPSTSWPDSTTVHISLTATVPVYQV